MITIEDGICKKFKEKAERRLQTFKELGFEIIEAFTTVVGEVICFLIKDEKERVFLFPLGDIAENIAEAVLPTGEKLKVKAVRKAIKKFNRILKKDFPEMCTGNLTMMQVLTCNGGEAFLIANKKGEGEIYYPLNKKAEKLLKRVKAGISNIPYFSEN